MYELFLHFFNGFFCKLFYVFLDDVDYYFLNFRRVAKKTSFRYCYLASNLLKCYPFPLLVLCLMVFSPEELLHLGGHCNLSAFVMNGSVWLGTGEPDRISAHRRSDGTAKPARLNHQRTCIALELSRFPLLSEESFSLEIMVKLIGKLHLDVAQNVFDDVLCYL